LVRQVHRLLPAALVLLGLTACSGGGTAAPAAPAAVAPAASATATATATATKAAATTLWLCRPGLPRNPCERGLDATVVDGDRQVVPFTPAAAPQVDCFYVYPTVSRATAVNAPAAVDEAMVATARAQVARFGEVCRVFAPVYRQITLSAIFTGHYEDTGPRAMAERDVELAWQDYLANDNDGRGVVLIGHSQGARTLTALLAKRIEKSEEARSRLVSALLLGGDVTVAKGSDTGGSFAQVPACRVPAQTGCVVAYSAYGATPPPDAVFGRAREAGEQVLCTDPSRLAGDDGSLHPYLPGASLAAAGALASAVPDVPTGFAAYPGQLAGECRVAGPVSYLHVTRAPGARLPVSPQPLGPRWGLHNGDVNLALGDLVEVVRRQVAAYSAG
jgi:hypothetical protein